MLFLVKQYVCLFYSLSKVCWFLGGVGFLFCGCVGVFSREQNFDEVRLCLTEGFRNSPPAKMQ